MKIFAIMIVKNEEDIIENVLAASCKWADKIFIVDNGSEDNTWNIIQSMKNEKIVPVKQDFRPFRDDMRAEIFNEFRHLASKDDWWAFSLDADEFYVDDPKEFLKNIPQKYHVVAKKSLDYVITEEDIIEHQFSGVFSEDIKFIKYLKPKCWSEYRFFRHRDSIKWTLGKNLHQPSPIGICYPKRILVKHYQYRSPVQMQKRLDTRNAIQGKNKTGIFSHINQNSWRELLVKRENAIYDGGGESFYRDEQLLTTYNNSLEQSFWKKIIIRAGISLKVW